jgi:hypothetical protein
MTLRNRIRNAEETVATTQSALDKLQSGLKAADDAVAAAEKAKRHPIAKATLMIAAILTIGLITMIVRGNSSD